MKQSGVEKFRGGTPIRLLLVEDDLVFACLLKDMLASAYSGQYQMEIAPGLAQAEALVRAHDFSAILLDLSLPDSQGLETVDRLVKAARHTPLVVLTGLDDDTVAEEAIRRGAQDYLRKNHIETASFARAIRYAIERKWAEEQLRRSEDELRKAQQVAHVGSWTWYIQADRMEWSDEMYRIFGLEKEGAAVAMSEVLARAIHPEDRTKVEEANSKVIHQKMFLPLEYRVLWPDGSVHVIWAKAGELILDAAGEPAILTGITQDITERKQAEERFRSLIEHSHDAITLLAADGTVMYDSPSISRVLGYEPTERLGRCVFDYAVPEERQKMAQGFALFVSQPDAVIPSLLRMRHKDGTLREIEGVRTNLLHVPAVRAVVVNYRDITERKKLQEQLLQAQKMEAIGQLAGVAHDFRNQLTVIKGYAERLLRRSLVKDEGREPVEEILKAAARSTATTSLLLSFARKQTLQPQIVNLAEEVADLAKTLPNIIGEDVRFSFVRGADPCHAHLDPDLFHQALMNLANNARDAMPGGGTLVIETAAVELPALALQSHPEFAPGRYVMVRVTDTGLGMSEELRIKIFDPFFTTKDVGKGTGLGLSMVYGFINQSRGFIELESIPGQGSTFRLYFPVADPAAGTP